MDFFADIFLGAGALAAAFYCLILSRKLSKLKALDQDLGGAIAVMSQQVDQMTKVLGEAQNTASSSSSNLETMTQRAESVAGKLEVLISALHDLSDEEDAGQIAEEVVDADENDEDVEDTTPESEDVTVFLRNPLRGAGGR
ncbi:hypothetical protein [Litoreibacter roseus]|uniref:DUF948 domain-containing protein n=1 Tax=Litoreibacter roseus TaxID=2601869 RepID=A0A6N6JG93_9RHOB|nr:hypothetical protein [Litoreibacter roseus]GFE64399.1 hypothetical protein KIN_14730 [Litoreibacter roseus]